MGTVVEEQLQTIQDNVDDAYTALSAKGATLPAVGSRGTENLAGTISTIGGDPANKAFEVVNGTLRSPRNINFSENTFSDVTSIGYYGLYYKYYYQSYNSSNPGGVINFDSVTSINESGLSSAFVSCNITSVSFNSLAQIKNANALNNAFSNNKSLTSISFPSLTSITGSTACFKSFYRCTSLTSIDLQNLEIANSYSCINECFHECTSLTSANFKKLKTLGDRSGYWIFYGCTSLSSVDFSALESIGPAGLASAFYGCSNLTTISFPSLTTVSSNSFYSCFSGCTKLTEIHFPAAIQATIESLDGYSSKFGATNATIYFDL